VFALGAARRESAGSPDPPDVAREISSILTMVALPSSRTERCRWLTETIEPPKRGDSSFMNPQGHRYQLIAPSPSDRTAGREPRDSFFYLY